MSHARTSAVQLAERVLDPARSAANTTGGALSRIQSCIETLRAGLEPFVGGAAFEVLLERAVVVARAAHPSLVSISVESGGKLRRTRDAGDDANAHLPAFEAIVREFVLLVMELIGEDLTTKLLGHVVGERHGGVAGPTGSGEEEK